MSKEYVCYDVYGIADLDPYSDKGKCEKTHLESHYVEYTDGVATGVASDGPIWSVFSSIWGGGQIPVVSGISRWTTSAWSVLNGDQFLPAMFNTFGATRELTSMFKDM